MTWLLIIFIVFVALAPLMTIMPTRAQKKVVNLREAAAVAGLQVQLQEPPGLALDKRLSACYGIRVGRQQRMQLEGSFVREETGWRNLDRRGDALPAVKLDFPEGVSHLVLTPDTLLAFWDEHGEIADVERLKLGLEVVLEACSESK